MFFENSRENPPQTLPAPCEKKGKEHNLYLVLSKWYGKHQNMLKHFPHSKEKCDHVVYII